MNGEGTVGRFRRQVVLARLEATAAVWELLANLVELVYFAFQRLLLPTAGARAQWQRHTRELKRAVKLRGRVGATAAPPDTPRQGCVSWLGTRLRAGVACVRRRLCQQRPSPVERATESGRHESKAPRSVGSTAPEEERSPTAAPLVAAGFLFVAGAHDAATVQEGAGGAGDSGGHLATAELLSTADIGADESKSKTLLPTIPSMPQPRYKPAVVSGEGQFRSTVVVFGGHNAGGKLASCEALDVSRYFDSPGSRSRKRRKARSEGKEGKEGKDGKEEPEAAEGRAVARGSGWERRSPMPAPRSHIAAARRPGTNTIFAVGGIGAKQRLRSVVTYDLAADKWSVLSEGCEMHRARAVPGCCFSPCGGFLYAVGGSDGESKLNSAERFGAQDTSPLCTVLSALTCPGLTRVWSAQTLRGVCGSCCPR